MRTPLWLAPVPLVLPWGISACLAAPGGMASGAGAADGGVLVDAGFADAECGAGDESDATMGVATSRNSGAPQGPARQALELPACGCGRTIHCGPAAGCDGGVVMCGECAPHSTCGGGGVPYECGSGPACLPLTCEQVDRSACASCGAGRRCQVVGDGCGHAVLCGPCR
jgi:hypothetical protein